MLNKMDMFTLLPLFFIPVLVNIIIFFRSLYFRKEPKQWFLIFEVLALVVYPVIFLVIFDSGKTDACCGMEDSFFGEAFRPTSYTFIGVSVIGYFISRFMSFRLHSPIIELLTTTMLVFGLIFSIVIGIHLNLWLFLLIGGGQVVMLFWMRLFFHFRRQRILMNEIVESPPENMLELLAYQVLQQSWWEQFPVIMLLFLPLLSIILSILMVFGQKPNSIILAFTQSYDFGFSTLECIPCDGHYLCTIAAHGSPKMVKPIRAGIRGRQEITVNRQLLISNAFEEILQEKSPRFHAFLRAFYNRIGRRATRFYLTLKKAWFSNVLYILMKPLEWFFLLCIYFFDTRPEDRIAQQYLRPKHRKQIKESMKHRMKKTM